MDITEKTGTDVKALKKGRGTTKASVTRLLGSINSLMGKDRIEEVKEKLEDLTTVLDRFQEAHRMYHHLLTEDTDKEESDLYLRAVMRDVQDLRHTALQWIETTDGATEQMDPPESIENSLQVELDRLRAVRAMEQEEFAVQREQYELELQRQRHRNSVEKQELQALLELNRLKAETASSKELYSTPQTSRTHSGARPSLSPVTEDSVCQLLELSRQQYQSHMDSMRLPPTDLAKFDGDPLKYWQFVRLFSTMVDKETVADEEKLTRLHQYTIGKARDAINHCLYNPSPSAGYREARERLKARFGNPHTISQAWIDKVMDYKEIKDNNQLRDFADQLRGCRDTLVAMNCEDELSGRRTLVEIVKKLPADLKAKWLNENYHITQAGRLPKLDDVVKFVETEATKRSDPVFGGILSSTKPSSATYSTNKAKKPYRQSFAATVQATTMSTNPSSSPKHMPKSKCPKCSETHYLNQCPSFRSLTVSDRLTFVRKKGVCENCFMMGHTSDVCTRNWSCNIPGCGQKHNRWLHPVTPQPSQTSSADKSSTCDSQPNIQSLPTKKPSVTCGFAGASNSKVCLPIVPVVVRGKGRNVSTVTYALLDPGSNTSLLSEELARKLKLKGKEGKMNLDTIGGCEERVRTFWVDLEIQSMFDCNTYPLNAVRTLPKLNIGLSCLATEEERAKWAHLRDIPIPDVSANDVHLIVGQDAPRLLRAEEYRVGGDTDPYATKTVLGWAINGPINHRESQKCAKTYFLKADTELERQVEKFWKLDGPFELGETMSVSDCKVISQWESSVKKDGSHYCLDIPFKSEAPSLPNDYSMAKHRLQLLGRRLMKDTQLCERYVEGMKATLDEGYAEEVPAASLDRDDGKVWYIPHHPVQHPRKPDKVRIVYDCSAKFGGVSLNDVVWQGPDLTHKLISVLLKFRQGPIAIMADIKGMFYQVRVTPDDRDALRFLWWRDNNPTKDILTYRMTTHLFGGVWSPSCANFALKRCAADNTDSYSCETISTVGKNFYVDDCLKSTESEQHAVQLAADLSRLLNEGGFHLTKWISNSREVLKTIPEKEHAKGVPSLDLDRNLPVERALGSVWDVETDCFGFDVTLRDKPNTKRGMLSLISSVYDPLGLVGPFVIRGKILFQMLCRRKVGWDEEIPDDVGDQWGRWVADLPSIGNLRVPRCLKPGFLEPPVTIQLHHFSDASELGFGAMSYLRVVDNANRIHCSLVMAKSRLAPIKPVTIPRLELTAAVVSVDLDRMMRQHLEFDLMDSVFWTDSTIVLHYLRNEEKRFHTFVANRVTQIRECSSGSQWKHVDTLQNPADDVSRSVSAEELVNSERWLRGPAFLWKNEESWPVQPILGDLPHQAEVKKSTQVYTVATQDASAVESSIDIFFQRYSSWHCLKRAVVVILRVKDLLRGRQETKLSAPISLMEMHRAETTVIQYVQRTWLTSQSKMDSLKGLCPVRSEDGVLRLSGRLANAAISEEAKHLAILPPHHHITKLLIWHIHQKTGHSGTERVVAESRQSFWIVKGRAAVRRVLAKCVPCRKRKAPTSTQYMANLPKDRVTPNQPPFTYVGVDYFGPLVVKRARSEVKRNGCLFTCLTSRAVHLEVAHSLDTDSFINALQRFTARHGKPKEMRSDNGTNFIGAKRELQRAVNDWNQQRIADHLLQQDTQWIFNPPAASHMGGIWERQIRTVRSILVSLAGQQLLDDEGLSTLLCIVEGIINGRPLTKLSDDPRDLLPLTPNDLLLLRSGPTLPPGHFTKQDAYRRRWRQVQYLADVFWTRWVKEYLPSLQQRQKWLHPTRNFQPGDLVLIFHENTPRCQWPLGLVTEAYAGADGLVRVVQVKTHSRTYTRPIHKLCLLEGSLG